LLVWQSVKALTITVIYIVVIGSVVLIKCNAISLYKYTDPYFREQAIATLNEMTPNRISSGF
jgi:hypothetical protein